MNLNENAVNNAKVIAAGAGAVLSIISSVKVIKDMNKPDNTVQQVEAVAILKAQMDILMGLDDPRLQLRGMQAMKAGTASFDNFINSLPTQE